MAGNPRNNGATADPARYECRLTYRVAVRLPPDAEQATVEAAAEQLVADGFGTLIEVETELFPSRLE